MQRASVSRESLAVVGGTYYERCILPPWDELYGSGLRAAAALSNRGTKITLHTGADQQAEALLRSIAASLQIAVEVTPVTATPAFAYLHPLAEPSIAFFHPNNLRPDPNPTIRVKTDRALVFGMMEATPVVEAEIAVYDPQAPGSPRPFRASGSTAKRLAVVANRQESRNLTGLADLHEAGRQLLESEQAEVVVIKDGPYGATVFGHGDIRHVSAYCTRRVFSIGSGDIFSAVFAYEWMVNGLAPVEAARAASLATAWYCESTSLPLPAPRPSDFNPEPSRRLRGETARKVYLAGPFFNLMQHLCVREVKTCLWAQGLRVFSPFHEVGVAGEPKAIAQADLAGLESCDVVFAILDGGDPGTIFEIGHARAREIPVVILLADLSSVRLTMFQGTGCHVFTDLASAVYAAAWVEKDNKAP